MAITPAYGYIIDPNNPSGVIRDPNIAIDPFASPIQGEASILSSAAGQRSFDSKITPVITKANENVATGIAYKAPETKKEEVLPPEVQAELDAGKTDQQKLDERQQVNWDAQKTAAEETAKALTLSQTTAAQGMISSLTRQWEERKRQMQQSNKATLGSWQQQFIRSGQAEYSPGMTGNFLSAKEQEGQDKLSQLDSEYNSKVAEINADLASKNFRAAAQKTSDLLKIEESAISAMKEQTKEAREVNKAIAKAFADAQKDNFTQVVKPIQDISADIAKNGAPSEIQSAVLGSKTVAEAILRAGTWLQTGAGTVGEWLAYNRDRALKGLSKIDYDTYATEDANRKIKVAAASQNAERVLSATEAQVLGVPFGTKAGAAYGKTVTKPPTEAQSKDGLYARRMDEANPTIKDLQSYVTTQNSVIFAKNLLLEDTVIGNPLVPDEIKQVRQAERNFLNAVLRKESGAVISPTEFSNGAKQYFPRPGDDVKTLAQKTQNRQTAISQMIKSSGSAYGGETEVLTLEQNQQMVIDGITQIGEASPDLRQKMVQMEKDGIPYLDILNWAKQQ